MPTAELNPVLPRPGEDYLDLEELLRQLPSPRAVHSVTSLQYKILPTLWKMFGGILDDDGEIMSGVKVREIAYSLAFELMRKRHEEEGTGVIIPDIAALAGGKKETHSGSTNGKTPPAADSLENVPCPQSN